MRTKRRLGIGISVATAVALAALSVAMVTPIVQQAGAQIAPIALTAEPNSNTALSFDLTVPTAPCVTETALTVNVACIASMTPVAMTSQSFGPSAVSVMDPISIDLVFTAAGGTSYVFGYQASDCTITEPGNGGATTTAITPATVNTDDPGVYPVSVVNTFVAVPTFTG